MHTDIVIVIRSASGLSVKRHVRESFFVRESFLTSTFAESSVASCPIASDEMQNADIKKRGE